MLFLPIGHDQTIKRFPWLTVAVMVLCTLLQLQRSFFAPSAREIADATTLRDQRGYALVERMHPPAEPGEVDEPVVPTFVPIAVPVELAQASPDKLLEAVRAGKIGDPNDRDVAAYKAAESNLGAVLNRDLVQRFGYRPTQGASINLLLSAFVHGGILHLAGNMLFLWLCGCNLEDRWGRPAFGVLYLLSAIVASFAYGLAHKGSDVPLVGASGAIAGVMGAFLVRFHAAQIRYWWWWNFRSGTVFLPAYVAFPVWFLAQVGQSFLEVSGFGEVAYSAHVGGFAFGVLAGVSLRFSGLERFLLPPDDDEPEAAAEPASPVRGYSQRPSARPFVSPSLHPTQPLYTDDPAILKPKTSAPPPFSPLTHAEIPPAPPVPDPSVPDVAPWPPPELAEAPETIDETPDEQHLALFEHALAARDPELADVHATRTFLWLAEGQRWAEIVALYDRFVGSGIARPLADRVYSVVVRAAVEGDDPRRCVAVAQKMAHAHPASPLLPRALWDVANAQQKGGRPDYARKTFGMLIDRFPQHRFAEEARKRLATQG